MYIPTRFNIGDVCYIIVDNKIYQGLVTEITIVTSQDYIDSAIQEIVNGNNVPEADPVISYGVNVSNNNKVYATDEEMFATDWQAKEAMTIYKLQ